MNSKCMIVYCINFTYMHADKQLVYILSISIILLCHYDFPFVPAVLSVGGIAGLTSGLVGSLGVCTGVPVLIVVLRFCCCRKRC